MSLIGLNPTLTTTRTLTAPLEVAHVDASNIRIPTTYTARTATATSPSTTSVVSPAGANRIVLGGRLNYIHLTPLLDVGGTSVTMNVIGWTKNESGTWIPRMLAVTTVTSAVTTFGVNVNGSAVYAGITYTKTQGDAKTYNGVAGQCTVGGIVVDLLGSELVEISMVIASGTVNFNALVSFI